MSPEYTPSLLEVLAFYQHLQALLTEAKRVGQPGRLKAWDADHPEDEPWGDPVAAWLCNFGGVIEQIACAEVDARGLLEQIPPGLLREDVR